MFSWISFRAFWLFQTKLRILFVNVSAHLHECRCHWRSEVSDPLDLEITASCKPPVMALGTEFRSYIRTTTPAIWWAVFSSHPPPLIFKKYLCAGTYAPGCLKVRLQLRESVLSFSLYVGLGDKLMAVNLSAHQILIPTGPSYQFQRILILRCLFFGWYRLNLELDSHCTIEVYPQSWLFNFLITESGSRVAKASLRLLPLPPKYCNYRHVSSCSCSPDLYI